MVSENNSVNLDVLKKSDDDDGFRGKPVLCAPHDERVTKTKLNPELASLKTKKKKYFFVLRVKNY